jgi:hypothetical protein
MEYKNMEEEIDKDFVINVLTNHALNKLLVTDALKIVQEKIKNDMKNYVENMNEVELKTVFNSIQEALKNQQENKEEENS